MAENSAGAWVAFALLVGGALLYQSHEASKERAAAAVEEQISARTAEIEAGKYQDTYGNEGCTLDCSGHEAGFAWAREHDIDSEDDCSSHGDADGSFAQGCKAFVQADEAAREEIEGEKASDP